ncbi:hypothetical protein IP88_02625 [alpha proteobacterium AAP81b]|nr:hypothetical protein IP88_02625 [alpha proteobacterium AAP81b]
MTAMSIREFNANVSAAIARAEAGETIEISRHGRVVAELRPKAAAGRVNKLDDPVFRANYERMLKGLEEGIPGLKGPMTYEERTER